MARDIINRHGFRTGWLIDGQGNPVNEVDLIKRGINQFNERMVARSISGSATVSAILKVNEKW